MKKIFFGFLLTGMVLGFALSASASEQTGKCLVMPGENVKTKFFADYQGERHFFCCRSCVRKFNKNPEKYLKK